MDEILSFFSDLILFTAGVLVVIFWIVIIIAISVEIYDLVTGKNQSEVIEMEDM